MYYLFLDDNRVPHKVNWVKLPNVNWVIVRNFEQFVNYIRKHGVPKAISFDHDLADEHYQEYEWAHDERNPKRGQFRYGKMQIKTGYDCAKWLIEYCMANNQSLPEYYLHTMNPIGAENIRSLFESAKKVIDID